jgi:HK97 family phage portal protein
MRNPFRRPHGPQPQETRTIDSVPWNVGGGTTGHVTEHHALSLAPVFSAVSLLAGSVSTLPLQSYMRRGATRVPLGQLPPLFAALEETGQIVPWLHRCMTSILLRGNAYGLVTSRDPDGYPSAVTWLDPDLVTVQWQAMSGPGSYTQPLWYWRGREIAEHDMVHIPWFTQAGRVPGLSPIRAFATTINAGLSVTDYGLTWFQNGGFPPGTFQNVNSEVTQEVAEAIGSRLDNAMRRRRPLVYGKDWEYKPISVPPDEAQFVASAQLSATQIASIYHVPPEWIGGQSGTGLHYSTAEQDQIQYVMHGVRPFVETLECAFYALLPQGLHVKFDTDALVRADLRTRHEVYAIDAGIGLRTIDEMRAQEDWAPLPPDNSGDDSVELATKIAEMVRKLYLGVDIFIQPDEARELLNRAGAGLPIPGPDFTPTPPATPPAAAAPPPPPQGSTATAAGPIRHIRNL